MKMSLVSVTRQAPLSYSVVLEEAGGQRRVFELGIQEGDITVVTWGDDFAAYLGQNLGAAAPLFELILAAHRLQGVDFPTVGS